MRQLGVAARYRYKRLAISQPNLFRLWQKISPKELETGMKYELSHVKPLLLLSIHIFKSGEKKTQGNTKISLIYINKQKMLITF